MEKDRMSRVIYVDSLCHYGVRGMKWGVRKQRALIGRRPAQTQTPTSDEQRNAQRKARAKKIAVGIGVAAAVVGVSYLALTKTEAGQTALILGRESVNRTLNTSKSIRNSNRFNPGRDKANYIPRTMRQYEKLSRLQAKRFAKETAQDVYRTELNRARSRNSMYTLSGRPNFTKNTMRQLEAFSRSTAKNVASDTYARYYDLELKRARSMNGMYHL